MVALAIAFGVMAILAGQRWLDRQAAAQRVVREPAATKPIETTIVVAKTPLKFGTEVTRSHLNEIPWVGEALPEGSFRSIGDILNGQGRRVALSTIEVNEPVLKAKITGPGQRASLAAVLEEGMKAVTVRVNDVLGVAGFVLPGERIDVLLTRNLEKVLRGSHSPERQGSGHRPDCRRPHRQAFGRQGRDAGSHHGASAEDRAGLDGRHLVVVLALGDPEGPRNRSARQSRGSVPIDRSDAGVGRQGRAGPSDGDHRRHAQHETGRIQRANATLIARPSGGG